LVARAINQARTGPKRIEVIGSGGEVNAGHKRILVAGPVLVFCPRASAFWAGLREYA
jgi:hypothetical protein